MTRTYKHKPSQRISIGRGGAKASAPPADSWWQTADRIAFTQRAEAEVPRMHGSRFGLVSFLTVYGPNEARRKKSTVYPEGEDI